jgi:hypothetical protein
MSNPYLQDLSNSLLMGVGVNRGGSTEAVYRAARIASSFSAVNPLE